jgi:hypothetical protein
MIAARETAGPLATAISHFGTVTACYGDQLFPCYDVPDLPRTNNALEQCFGSVRYHERRATGRKGASPGLVVRGAVRLVAAVATRVQAFAGPDLQPTDLAAWATLRAQLARRQGTRCAQRRFRHDPHAYLAALETALT